MPTSGMRIMLVAAGGIKPTGMPSGAGYRGAGPRGPQGAMDDAAAVVLDDRGNAGAGGGGGADGGSSSGGGGSSSGSGNSGSGAP